MDHNELNDVARRAIRNLSSLEDTRAMIRFHEEQNVQLQARITELTGLELWHQTPGSEGCHWVQPGKCRSRLYESEQAAYFALLNGIEWRT